MSKLLFRLNDVPDDEAEDIRELLDTNQLSFYETNAGRWGISIAAIWLTNNSDFEQARLLVDEYQQQRLELAETERNKLREYQSENQIKQTIVGQFVEQFFASPMKFIVAIAAVALIIYISIAPFFYR